MLETAADMFRKISRSVGIEWAPLNVPMSRRLQTLAATAWVCLALFGQGTLLYLFLTLLYSDYWWLGILYAAWMLNDIDVCHKGGRTIQWVRNWGWWNYFRDYFPIKLVKTADLEPSKNYLFACYPHGVLSSGAYCSFATNALNFHKLFPGLTPHLIVLGGHFLFPFFRDLILSLGTCASSQESLLHLLNPKRFQGNCVAIMVGGAAEALDSHPGKYKIILSRRKGFIRIAMKSGASLVPVFSFGETDVFRPLNNPENSLLRRIQEKVRQITGVSPVFPLGRGMFQYSFGVVPLRSPVTTVVGAPMEVTRNLEPTDEEVDEVHAEFTKRLVQLFENEKSKYLKNHEEVQLVIT
ncbi:2-acylglycerol O-acyltransferase 2-A-like [Bombyx mandarina]|uniref:Acyltransferase n=1 Tax=Bombyx mandarina TaxID=7092 RepID=A0A6J2KQU5_BOMMA|nr:2-acylglycerol O-acyltransferase 2-A-like [Bombyx mandarina]